ncbi:type I-E CRISPR-associated protein Cse1/CasA [Nocardia terpenica]|uniref:Type I-E CRISPR-associated protein Cse1/CasA n=1 Tax=Nocardia terpenica TaxID=455432 RepID=A0A6G9Z0C4_9NOCA|nr:type I-E CRISPR-associated protein Cse1/CasA [Nocardia terpenica]QIS18912.1 type I-E CRISPR-associated protein Cse1/CasA [Nocardia terpenica]
MTCAEVDFDLTERPWIHATDLGGHPRELSLREVFDLAPQLAALTGEVPTQSFAILRLLLAVVRRALAHRTGAPAQIWGDLWGNGTRPRQLPTEEIDAYLTKHQNRFWLFDPVVPFMQVAQLRSATDAVSALDRLIADVPNGDKYFTTRAGASVERIGFAEAARWLVHAHAFDPSGIKTGAVGDPRVKKSKGYPIGVAWTGGLGGVFVEGATLAETLLLNLVLRDRDGNRFHNDDLPAWERLPDTATQRKVAIPTGPVDLFTWQSRRIRLVHNSSHVTGVVLCNGDALDPFNRQAIEPMTGWRYSEIQTKKSGQPRHYPSGHDPQRALWRGLTGLLGEIANPSPTTGRAIPPGVAEWIRYLIDEDALDPAHPVRLHATGMQYINNQSVVGDIIDDTLGFRAALLATDPNLRTCALNAVQIADGSVDALATLAGNLSRAIGGDPLGARQRARERGFFALDAPYRQWLTTLDPAEGAYDRYDAEWQAMVRSVIEPLGTDLLLTAGPPAWTGREIDGQLIDAGRAEIWFRHRLRKLLPDVYPRTTEHEEPEA